MLDGLLNQFEHDMFCKLSIDFPDEIQGLEKGLGVLRRSVLEVIHSEPILDQPDLITALGQAHPDVRCSAIWAMLLNEAVDRLLSAQLLLLTGHQSRALACGRDAIECLQWAEICSSDDKQAKKWVRGKRVKTKGFIHSPQISALLTGNVDEILNTQGTHAYIWACLVTITPAVALASNNSGDGEFEIYKMFTKRTFMALMYITGAAIEYVLNTESDLEKVIPEGREAARRLSTIINSLVADVSSSQAPSE
jgi:hypothetical protein